jgi:homoserine kinase
MYSQSVLDRMGETSGAIMKARALAAMGMPDLARSAWLLAAAGEEQVAPLLEMLSRDREAAVHRISAASCYQSAGELGKAINLYRAALAGPLLEHTREETEQKIVDCLAQLARPVNGNADTGSTKRGA